MLQSFLRARKTTSSGPITFISSSIDRKQSVSSITLAAPTGIQNGDLIVGVFYATTASISTVPTGFTAAYTDNSANNPRLTIAWKIASNESGGYTISAASSTNLAAAMLVYRNATFDVTGTTNRTTSNSLGTATSISTTSSGVLIAAFSIAGTTATVSTPPSGMTLRASINSGETGPSVFIYDQTLTASGATGSRSVSFSSSLNNTGILLSIK